MVDLSYVQNELDTAAMGQFFPAMNFNVALSEVVGVDWSDRDRVLLTLKSSLTGQYLAVRVDPELARKAAAMFVSRFGPLASCWRLWRAAGPDNAGPLMAEMQP